MRTEDRFRWNLKRLKLIAEQTNLTDLQGLISDPESIDASSWRDSIQTACEHLIRKIEIWQAGVASSGARALLCSAPALLGLEQMGICETANLGRIAELACQSARQQLADLPSRWSVAACGAIAGTFPRGCDAVTGNNVAADLRLKRRVLVALEEAAGHVALVLQSSLLNRLIEAVDSMTPLAAACEEVYRSITARFDARQSPHACRLEERLAQRRAAYLEALEGAAGISPRAQLVFKMGTLCSSLCDSLVRDFQKADFTKVVATLNAKEWRDDVSLAVLNMLWEIWNANEQGIVQAVEQRIHTQFADLICDWDEWIDAAYNGHRESLPSEVTVESLRLEAREIARVAATVGAGLA